MFQIMAYHPIYLEHFLRAHHHVLYGDGPLPFNYRHYIAIMVSKLTYFEKVNILLAYCKVLGVYQYLQCKQPKNILANNATA